MNEYMKPDYEVMVFEANEYVAACDNAGQHIMLDCAEHPTGVVFKIGQALVSQVQDTAGEWFQRIDGYYISNNEGTISANLWFTVDGGTKNENNLPIFMGPMANGHTNVSETDTNDYSGGEFDNSGAGSGNQECGCQHWNGSSWQPAHGHHHIQSYTFTDRS